MSSFLGAGSSGSGGGGRTILTGNLSLATDPLTTIQRSANNTGADYDYASLYFPTINAADGTYNEDQIVLPSLLGCGFNTSPAIIDQMFGGSLIGNVTTPDNVIVNAGLFIPGFASWDIEGVKIIGGGSTGPLTTGSGITVYDYGFCNISSIDFSDLTNGVVVYERGLLEGIGASFTVSGNIANDVFQGNCFLYGATLTLNNNPTMGDLFNIALFGFAGCAGLSIVNGSTATFTSGYCIKVTNKSYADFGGVTVDGSPLTLAGFAGAPVLLDASSTFIDGNGVVWSSSGTVTTFASLPAASLLSGFSVTITDGAANPVLGAVAAGGGSTVTMVWSDGSNWRNVCASGIT